MSDHHKQHQHGSNKRKPHQDWRMWAVVGVMLFAMLIYVFTMDESIVPGGEGVEQPAADAVAE